MSRPVVVDASALVAALCDSGADGSWAASLLAPGALAAPELLMFEAANTLRRLEMAKFLTRAEAALAHADLTAVQIQLWPYAPLADRVWQLRGSVTCYDAAYVAVAELLGAPLVTLDRRLAKVKGKRCEVLVPR